MQKCLPLREQHEEPEEGEQDRQTKRDKGDAHRNRDQQVDNLLDQPENPRAPKIVTGRARIVSRRAVKISKRAGIVSDRAWKAHRMRPSPRARTFCATDDARTNISASDEPVS